METSLTEDEAMRSKKVNDAVNTLIGNIMPAEEFREFLINISYRYAENYLEAGENAACDNQAIAEDLQVIRFMIEAMKDVKNCNKS